MSSVVLSVDATVDENGTTVSLQKVTNSVGDDITDMFRTFASNNQINLNDKEALYSAAGKFAKEFNDMPWLP